MPLSLNQEALRTRLLIELDCASMDARGVAGDLSPEQLAWLPQVGGWGVGHTLEHLILSHDSYLDRMRGLIYERKAPHGENGHVEWEPTMAGWLLVASLRSKKKRSAPKIWTTGPEPRERVLDAFLERQQMVITFLKAAAALDWTRVKLRSPAAGWIRINLGDAFTVLTVHAQRHIKQMERIRDHPGFPA